MILSFGKLQIYKIAGARALNFRVIRFQPFFYQFVD
jgi:hypothetical protein